MAKYYARLMTISLIFLGSAFLFYISYSSRTIRGSAEFEPVWPGSGTIKLHYKDTPPALPAEMHIVDFSGPPPTNVDFKCAHTSIYPYFDICLYTPKVDPYISKCMLSKGHWESKSINMMLRVLESNPGMGLIDCGVNVGAYALPAARQGFPVVAIDPLPDNIIRLHKGIELNNVVDNITVLQNILTGRTGNSSIAFGKHPAMTRADDKSTERVMPVDAITMDALVDILPFKKAFLKLDIEGMERPALAASGRLFKDINIPFVIVEHGFRKTEDFQWVANFFLTRGYQVFDEDGENLTEVEPGLWSWDVYMVKPSCINCEVSVDPYDSSDPCTTSFSMHAIGPKRYAVVRNAKEKRAKAKYEAEKHESK